MDDERTAEVEDSEVSLRAGRHRQGLFSHRNASSDVRTAATHLGEGETEAAWRREEEARIAEEQRVRWADFRKACEVRQRQDRVSALQSSLLERYGLGLGKQLFDIIIREAEERGEDWMDDLLEAGPSADPDGSDTRAWSGPHQTVARHGPPQVRSLDRSGTTDSRVSRGGDQRGSRPWNESEETAPMTLSTTGCEENGTRSAVSTKIDKGGSNAGDREGVLSSTAVTDREPRTPGAKRLFNIKLPTFDGSTALETFLAKFDTVAKYGRWDDEDKLFHLSAALEGPAGQVLWDVGSQLTFGDVVQLLKSRFGHLHQAERFRAEIRARRRKPGETLQKLYQDLCRLFALAYPLEPQSTASALMARDAFLDALGDGKLRLEVLQWEPTSIEQALSLASKYEAYSISSGNDKQGRSEEPPLEQKCRAPRGKQLKAIRGSTNVSGPASSDPTSRSTEVDALRKLVGELQNQVTGLLRDSRLQVSTPSVSVPSAGCAWQFSPASQCYQAVPYAAPDFSGASARSSDSSLTTLLDGYYGGVVGNQGYASVAGQSFGNVPPYCAVPANLPGDGPASYLGVASGDPGLVGPRTPVGQSADYGGSDRGGPPRVRTGESGQTRFTQRNVDRDTCRKCKGKGHWARECPQGRDAGDVHLKVVTTHSRPAEVYAKGRFRGKPVQILMDTGCDRSLIARKYVTEDVVSPTALKLQAANGSDVPLLGELNIKFSIEGHMCEANVGVSDVIDEIILGSDWLASAGCQWDFVRSILHLGGRVIKLHKRDTKGPCVRRIYVAEETIVPSAHQGHVPVKMMLGNLHVPATDWAVEPREIKPGVVTARTVVSGLTPETSLRVLNLSDKPYIFRADSFVGVAEAAEVCAGASTTDERASKGPPPGGPLQVRGGPKVSGPPQVRSGPNTVTPDGSDWAHIQCVLDKLPTDLTESQREQATEFLRSKAHVFSRDEFDIGRTHIIEHAIDTGDHKPVKQALHRHPTAHLPIIDQHVEEMLKHDVIEPAASPWCSNVVLIRKHDGSLRFCVDYRSTNSCIYKDNFPLARIDTCLEALGGNEFYTTLDLRAGYWQTLIRPEDRDKTAFVTRKGQWRFKVLSFGLCNAPSQFARTMELVLQGLTYESCLVYLDDIVCFGRTFQQHLERLDAVLSRLEAANLKLKPSKCFAFQRKVTFLGHVVGKEGIECSPDKVEAVQNWPRPTSVSEVRSFVGLAGYYRSFVKDFANIARPLTTLTKKNAVFRWTDVEQVAFDRLKVCLTTSPVLASPRDEGRFVLDTDASNFALGAVLQQEQDDRLPVIAYASRALADSERNYCTTRKELLAVVYGLKKFRHYLLGRHFLIRTDHAALTYLQRTPTLVGQQSRWLDLIGEFSFEIQHRAGTAGSNADGLSRIPCARLGLEICRQCGPKEFTDEGRTEPPDRADSGGPDGGPEQVRPSTAPDGSDGGPGRVRPSTVPGRSDIGPEQVRHDCDLDRSGNKADWGLATNDGQNKEELHRIGEHPRVEGSSHQRWTVDSETVQPSAHALELEVTHVPSTCSTHPAVSASIAGQNENAGSPVWWSHPGLRPCVPDDAGLQGKDSCLPSFAAPWQQENETVSKTRLDSENEPAGGLARMVLSRELGSLDTVSPGKLPRITAPGDDLDRTPVTGDSRERLWRPWHMAAQEGNSVGEVQKYRGLNAEAVAFVPTQRIQSDRVAVTEPGEAFGGTRTDFGYDVGQEGQGGSLFPTTVFAPVLEVGSRGTSSADAATSEDDTGFVPSSVGSAASTQSLRQGCCVGDPLCGAGAAPTGDFGRDFQSWKRDHTRENPWEGPRDIQGIALLKGSDRAERGPVLQDVAYGVSDAEACARSAVGGVRNAPDGIQGAPVGVAGNDEEIGIEVTGTVPVTTCLAPTEFVEVSSNIASTREVFAVQSVAAGQLVATRQAVTDMNADPAVLFSVDNIRLLQRADPSICQAMTMVEENTEPPAWTEVQNKGEELRIYWSQFQSLVIENDVLYRRYYAPEGTTKWLQLVMPPCLRKAFVLFVHQTLKHVGAAKTAAELTRRCYFPGWRSYTQLVLKTCDVCARFKRGPAPRQTPLHPQQAAQPLDCLQIDLVGPLPHGRRANGERGFCWILTVLDTFSKYLITVALRNKETETVTDALVHEVYLKGFIPRRVQSDLGPEFQASSARAVNEALGITQTRSTAYKPTTCGQVEKSHAVLSSMLSKLVNEKQNDWPVFLPGVTLAYNMSVHSTTGQTPFSLIFGRECLCALDIVLPTPAEGAEQPSVPAYALDMTERLQQSFEFVREHTGRKIETMRKRYDSKIKSRQFEVNDLVYYFYPRQYKGKFRKWCPAWIGVFKVVRKLNSVVYVIQRSPRAKEIVVHNDKLKKYCGEVPAVWREREEDIRHPAESKQAAPPGSVRTDRPGSAEQHVPSRQVTPPRNRPKEATTHRNDVLPSDLGHSRPRRKGRRPPARYCCQVATSVAAPAADESLLCHKQAKSSDTHAKANSQGSEAIERFNCHMSSSNIIQSMSAIKKVGRDDFAPRGLGQARDKPAFKLASAGAVDHLCWQGSSTELVLCPRCDAPFQSVRGLRRHCILQHGLFYRKGGFTKEIPPDELDAVQTRERWGCLHKRQQVAILARGGKVPPRPFVTDRDRSDPTRSAAATRSAIRTPARPFVTGRNRSDPTRSAAATRSAIRTPTSPFVTDCGPTGREERRRSPSASESDSGGSWAAGRLRSSVVPVCRYTALQELNPIRGSAEDATTSPAVAAARVARLSRSSSEVSWTLDASAGSSPVRDAAVAPDGEGGEVSAVWSSNAEDVDVGLGPLFPDLLEEDPGSSGTPDDLALLIRSGVGRSTPELAVSLRASGLINGDIGPSLLIDVVRAACSRISNELIDDLNNGATLADLRDYAAALHP